MPVDTSRKAEIISAMESKYEGSVVNGNEMINPPRIPFDNLELNYITGGGVPMGRWSRFYGGWSSTKTRTCYGIIAEAQRMGQDCVYYNVEKQFTTEAAERAGVDTKELLIIEGTTVEAVGDAIEGLMSAAHVHVIDSCSGAISLAELNADLTDQFFGIKARAWGRALSRAHERMDPKENTCILIDQMRTQTSGGKMSQTSQGPPGGNYMQFLSSLNLNFKKGKWLQYDKYGELSEKAKGNKRLGGSEEPDGRVIKIRNEKSRIGRPEQAANLYFDLGNYEFDIEWEYAKALKHLGWAKQSGSWWQVDCENAEDKVQGDHGLRELVYGNEELMQEIMDAVMDLNRYNTEEEE